MTDREQDPRADSALSPQHPALSPQHSALSYRRDVRMRVGLVGFSGGGKSTVFQLLTGATPDPGKVHSGQVGIATLADPRLDFLAALHKPKKVTPATVEML